MSDIGRNKRALGCRIFSLINVSLGCRIFGLISEARMSDIFLNKCKYKSRHFILKNLNKHEQNRSIIIFVVQH